MEGTLPNSRNYERILVIRLGALGDFVLSLGPMAAIRRYHANARVTLLTTPPFAEFAGASGYCDTVWIDRKPRWAPFGWWRLGRRLRAGRFERVYDLQTSDRTARYWTLMGKPEWSGHVPGCALPDSALGRDALHTFDRQAGQLRAAGIEEVAPADLSWVQADTTRFGLPRRFVLLLAGGAPHRPGKRWPADKYASLARWMLQRAVTPVLLGTEVEAVTLRDIGVRARGTIDLCGKTSFADIVGLARTALGAIGNDTGPMHLIANAGCPSLVLFSEDTDPALCAPRPGKSGGRVAVLRRPKLMALSVEEVQAALPFSLTVAA